MLLGQVALATGRRQLIERQLIGREPAGLGQLAIGARYPSPERAAEHHADELGHLPARVAVGLVRRVAQDGDYPAQVDIVAEFLPALPARAFGEGLAGLEAAAGQAPRPSSARRPSSSRPSSSTIATPAEGARSISSRLPLPTPGRSPAEGSEAAQRAL